MLTTRPTPGPIIPTSVILTIFHFSNHKLVLTSISLLLIIVMPMTDLYLWLVVRHGYLESGIGSGVNLLNQTLDHWFIISLGDLIGRVYAEQAFRKESAN